MEYKEFISKLYIKGVWLAKDEFSMELFLSAVNDTSVITDKRSSIQSYKGYNRGNPINEISYDVISDLNKSGIESFLEEYLNQKPDKKLEYSQKICDKFNKEISCIIPENLCEKIAAFFIDEVLKPTAKEYEKTNANAKAVSIEKAPDPIQETQNAENCNDNDVENSIVSIDNISTTNINETFDDSTTNHITLIKDGHSNNIIINTSSKNADELAGLKALINELNSRFMDLDEKGIILHMSSWLRSEEERNEKEQEFEIIKSDFINENKKLRKFYLIFPELKEKFEKMLSLSRTLTFWYGYKRDEQNHTRIDCDHQIEEYRKCINEVWKILSK